ncbi:RNA pseudouridylate synthase domain-containing protein 2 [Halotydeus destructor]|nr:RNA pseudouridylate synthase domain-containing protein 2 [Halotydeus destructor]
MEAIPNCSVKRKHSEGPVVGKIAVKKSKEDYEKYDETDYYFEDYLRKVYPYHFTYFSGCKGRWIGRKFIDVMKAEFRALPEEKLISRLEQGLSTVNDKKVPVDYILKNGDSITSRVHRHELPTLAMKMKIVHECDDLLVIDKPPSLPIHPCGRYRYNSIVAILNREYGYKKLHIIHRLDRLTSGVLLLAKTTDKARSMTTQIQDRDVQKEYLCRVEGDFPFKHVLVDQPIERIAHKIGLCMISPAGKASSTEFEKISFNGKSSLVRCLPKTGRMHQIRLHLQYLGYPIMNDPMYNSFAFGPHKGKDANYGVDKEELIKALATEHCVENWFEESAMPEVDRTRTEADIHFEDHVRKAIGDLSPKFDASRVLKDDDCIECSRRYINPAPKHLLIYLHALKYSGDGWSYETEPPIWAAEDWKD